MQGVDNSERAATVRKLLTPTERKIAFMYCAGVSSPAISIALDVYAEKVLEILRRPHVESFVARVSAQAVASAADVASELSARIERATDRAFTVEESVMERLYSMSPEKDADFIKAQLGAAVTAQDILDRAGKRAPTRVVSQNLHAIDPGQLDHLVSVMQEVGLAVGRGPGGAGSIDVTPLPRSILEAHRAASAIDEEECAPEGPGGK